MTARKSLLSIAALQKKVDDLLDPVTVFLNEEKHTDNDVKKFLAERGMGLTLAQFERALTFFSNSGDRIHALKYVAKMLPHDIDKKRAFVDKVLGEAIAGARQSWDMVGIRLAILTVSPDISFYSVTRPSWFDAYPTVQSKHMKAINELLDARTKELETPGGVHVSPHGEQKVGYMKLA